MRFFLIDRILEFEPGRSGTALKNVALSEDFFDDHFPQHPIMPGALIVEGMAQLAGLVLEEGVRQATGAHPKALMSIIERAKFRAPVRPGDRLEYCVSVESVNEAGGRASAQARRDGTLVAQCTLVFSFHEVDDPVLEARRTELLSLWLSGREGDGR